VCNVVSWRFGLLWGCRGFFGVLGFRVVKLWTVIAFCGVVDSKVSLL
jgi:hypothetical protein